MTNKKYNSRIVTNDRDEIYEFLGLSNGSFENIQKLYPGLLHEYKALIDSIIEIAQLLEIPAFILLYDSKTGFALKRWVLDNYLNYQYKELFEKFKFHKGLQLAIRFKGFHDGMKKLDPSEHYMEAVCCNTINLNNKVDIAYSSSITLDLLSHTKSASKYFCLSYQNSKTLANRKKAYELCSPIYSGKILCLYNDKPDEKEIYKYYQKEWCSMTGKKLTPGPVKTDIYDINSHKFTTSIKTNCSTQLASMSIVEQLTLVYSLLNELNIKISNEDKVKLEELFKISNDKWFNFNNTITYIKSHKEHFQYPTYIKMLNYKELMNNDLLDILLRNPDIFKAIVIDALTGNSKYKAGSSAIPTLFMHIIPSHPELSSVDTLSEFLKKYLQHITCSFEWKSFNGTAFISLRVYLKTTIAILKEIHNKNIAA